MQLQGDWAADTAAAVFSPVAGYDHRDNYRVDHNWTNGSAHRLARSKNATPLFAGFGYLFRSASWPII